MKDQHIPVLLSESLDYLVTDKAGNYFDGTLGFGGHSGGILERMNNDGLLISTDLDKAAFKYCKKKFVNQGRIKLYNLNFSLIDVIAKLESIKFYNGVIADLGVSSFQLDNPSAGFTYSTDAPLDLRMDKNLKVNVKVNASDIINTLDEKKLSNIIYEFGEEKNSRKIARQIVLARRSKEIKTTGALKKLIAEITSPRYQTKTLSRVFQALRIHVNNELDFLKQFLNNSINIVKRGGRLVIISYHSLEDRIVKEFFKYGALSCICPSELPVCTCDKVQRLKILTKKPVVPQEEEIKKNKRARSAKLRVAERV
jgi:16S rRNA (cytosine1402-N4)-methyltransferase